MFLSAMACHWDMGWSFMNSSKYCWYWLAKLSALIRYSASRKLSAFDSLDNDAE